MIQTTGATATATGSAVGLAGLPSLPSSPAPASLTLNERTRMKRGKQIDTWYPMFIDKWLFGSTRHELIVKTEDGSFKDMRGIFLDLLTLSKKDKGFIRANETTPYPHEQLAGMFCVPLDDLRLTIALCLKHGKLSESTPGIYYINSTETYSLSDRWKREKAANPETSEKTEHYSENAEVRGEDIREKDRIGNESIYFDATSRRWLNITPQDQESWAEAYPACDLKVEFAKMGEWLVANPTKAVKSNWRRFIVNWLSRSQDRGGGAPSRRQAADMRVGESKVKDHSPSYWAEHRRLKSLGYEGERLTDELAKLKEDK